MSEDLKQLIKEFNEIELMNDYKVEDNDIVIIKQRIDERRPKTTNKGV